MKKIALFFVCCFSLGVLTSNARVSSTITTAPTLKSEQLLKINEMISSFTADGSGLSYSELTKLVKEAKGENLTLKEKIGLKIFRKKISNSLVSANKNDATAEGGAGGGKSQLVATLLCFFLGGLGVHRFYLGYTWQGIVQILTLGGLGIWVLIDFIRILMGTLKPKDGEYEKTL